MNVAENNILSFELPSLSLDISRETGSRYFERNRKGIMFDDAPIEYPKQRVLSFEELFNED